MQAGIQTSSNEEASLYQCIYLKLFLWYITQVISWKEQLTSQLPPPPPPNYCAILKAMNCKNKSLAYISNWKFKYKRFPVYETQDGFCIIYKQTLLQSGIME